MILNDAHGQVDWPARILAIVSAAVMLWREWRSWSTSKAARTAREQDVTDRQESAELLKEANRIHGEAVAHLEDANRLRSDGLTLRAKANTISRDALDHQVERSAQEEERQKPKVILRCDGSVHGGERQNKEVPGLTFTISNDGPGTVQPGQIQIEVLGSEGPSWVALCTLNARSVPEKESRNLISIRRASFASEFPEVIAQHPNMLQSDSSATGRWRVTFGDDVRNTTCDTRSAEMLKGLLAPVGTLPKDWLRNLPASGSYST